MPSAVELEPAPASVAAVPTEPPRIALIGNPNTGKTTLFNRLAGTRAKTSNFPGTTTSVRVGRAIVGGDRLVDVLDLPGLYRLDLDLPEARIVRDVLGDTADRSRPTLVLVVVDACNLTRNLVLTGELLRFGLPVVVALNMIDLAQRRGLTLDAARMSAELGCPVVPIVARRGEGLDELRQVLGDAVGLARGLPARIAAAAGPVGPKDDLVAWAETVVEASVGGRSAIGAATDTVTERMDKAFTHPVLGLLVFVGVMVGLFWTLFALATVPMDLIEATFARLGDLAGRTIPPGLVHDLVAEGIIGGIAGTLVFLPQICLLFFLISLLEDTGYLARAAFVMDRVLCRFGLPGHAFVPLLTSHACALPGIMSARLIPDRRDRLTTILVAPFMSCSARLPVYVLLTSLLFAGNPWLGGVAFAGCYALGAIVALGSAFLFRRTLLRGEARPMILELPSYKMPSLTNALITARDQGFAFLKTAGTAIMAICVVMWWLNTFPRVATPPEAESLMAQAETAGEPAAAELRARADAVTARAAQAGSFAGMMGRAIQPVFAPLGFDWQLTIGVLTSFLAREVFVSTMSVLVAESADPDEPEGVIAKIRSATRDDGSLVFTTATATSLLVFFVLAMQCLPTLAVTRRETGRLRWPLLQLGYMSAVAYLFALATFQGLRALGIS